MNSSLVIWNLKHVAGTFWALEMHVAGVGHEVVRVEAIDRDAAAKAVAVHVELALRQRVVTIDVDANEQ